MREHEVPTHVQAEDKVLLWFTFPQIVAVTAVGALAYGIYHYAPIPSSEVRIGLAVLFALVGLAAIVGRVGGRRLPLVAADLLQYRLGGRCYAGTPAQLARSEPPAPSNDNPGLIQQMTEKTRHRLRRLRRGSKRRKGRERRNGRRPLRWLRKPRDRGKGDGGHAAMRRTALLAAMALLGLTARWPQPALRRPNRRRGRAPRTPRTSPDRWRNEIDFDPPDPVPGRRLYVEKSRRLRGQGHGHPPCRRGDRPQRAGIRRPRWPGAALLGSGKRGGGSSPSSTRCRSPATLPSFTFAWVDASGQAGAVSLKGEQIPHPLPVVEGELCDVQHHLRSDGVRARSPGRWRPESASTPWNIPSTSSSSTGRSTSRGRWS